MDGYVVGEFEYPAVFVVLLLQGVYPGRGQLDPLFPCTEVTDDEPLIEKFEYAFGRRLLTHLQRVSEFSRRYGDVVVHSADAGQFSQGKGVFLVHEGSIDYGDLRITIYMVVSNQIVVK